MEQPPTPFVSVLIPAYNEEDLIDGALDSAHESFAALVWTSYEILVCDNASTDRTAEIASAQGAKVVLEPHRQIARARNTAARNARGEWLVFMDADTRLNPGVLDLTIQELQSGRACGGGSVMRFDGETGPVMAAMVRAWNWGSRRFHVAAGAYVYCLREAWRDLGGFDEGLYVSEEIDFSVRLRRWGKPRGMKFVVVTGAPVVTSSRKLAWHGMWRIIAQFLVLLLPGAIRSRRLTWQWYERKKRG